MKRPQRLKQLPALRCITCLAGCQAPEYDVALIRGNQMKFRAPTAAAASNRLGTVFFLEHQCRQDGLL